MAAPAIQLEFAARAQAPAHPPVQGGVDLVMQMAHDLRSPLSSILVLAEALQTGTTGPVNAEQRRQLGLIYGAALSLCSSASDMIDMARSGDSLLRERPSPFLVSLVLNSVRDTVQPMVEQRDLELRLVYPGVDRRRGHARSLARVLLNLATNAIKATESGFVEIAVRETAGNPQRVEFSVKDTGCGVRPVPAGCDFESSLGARSELRQQFTSAGLGLGLCRRLVAAMGSTLEVESRPGRGSRFSFGLSLAYEEHHAGDAS